MEFGHKSIVAHLAAQFAALGYDKVPIKLREKDGAPVVTDNNNLIYDCAFGAIQNAAKLAVAIKSVPGAVEHGLFVGIATTLLIAGPGEVEVIQRA
jgi:ribose 5-phosphate isomerase A